MKDESNLAYNLDLSSLDLQEESSYEQDDIHDDHLLDKMRGLIRDYVQASLASLVGEAARAECKGHFDQLRSKLRDGVLREYSSFEFMEKLYIQEFSARNAT